MRRAADNVVNQFQNYVIDQTYYSNRETLSLENNLVITLIIISF